MTRDALVFSSEFDDFKAWEKALHAALPDLEIVDAGQVRDNAAVRYALVWNPPIGFFSQFPNLSLVINIGAGVDRLLGRADLPDVPITRISDPGMARMMGAYVLFAVLRHARDIPFFENMRQWRYRHPRNAAEIKVGILGLGELGAVAAQECARQGFEVSGWSLSARVLAGVRCLRGGEGLDQILRTSDILVCMLPLTPATRGLLNGDRLALLPRGAAFVNVSRGDIVDEPALIAALQNGRIGSATLDVFSQEPLPDDSPLWTLDNVLITPHVASIALPDTSAAQIAENITRTRNNHPVANAVCVVSGY